MLVGEGRYADVEKYWENMEIVVGCTNRHSIIILKKTKVTYQSGYQKDGKKIEQIQLERKRMEAEKGLKIKI